MTSKTSDKSQWTDPKDYGLPFVVISPLIPVPVQPEKEPIKEEVAHVSVPIDVEIQPFPDPVDIKVEQEIQPVKLHVEPIEKITDPEEKRSNSWVWIIAILAIAIVGVIIYQIQKESNSDTSVNLEEEETSSIENNSNQAAEELKITPSQEIQTTENQEIIGDSTVNQIPPIQTPQTGTTIESTPSGTLVRIESKKERPQYFIVVGSLPSEALAVKEAALYYDRAQTLYLIFPYDDVKNYRLAIGAFGSFSSATAELESAKGRYSEALWILKY
jgi:hypothetical protein